MAPGVDGRRHGRAVCMVAWGPTKSHWSRGGWSVKTVREGIENNVYRTPLAGGVRGYWGSSESRQCSGAGGSAGTWAGKGTAVTGVWQALCTCGRTGGWV